MAIVPKDIKFEELRRFRALFSRLIHTRPDLACIANRASQVSEQTFCLEKVRELNRGVKRAKETSHVGLMYKVLDKASLEIRVYADESFPSNDDLSSKLGYIVLLFDRMNPCHILDFSSKKSKLVVRSIVAAEVYAFLDDFDTAYSISIDIKKLLKSDPPIFIFTDSKKLFDAITKGNRTTEKRLMIDIASARHSYRKFEISGAGLIQRVDNPADALSEISCNSGLNLLLKSSKDITNVVIWIEQTHRNHETI